MADGRWPIGSRQSAIDAVQSAIGNVQSAMIETLPELDEKTQEKVKEAFEKNWNVIVWNDPVNLMSYVVFVFMRVLAFTKEKATQHMLQVHHQGKSVVATETREKAELYHQQIQAHGLSVTLETSS
jgi:ATP-dependent Clp protease adaptor protein ClpS